MLHLTYTGFSAGSLLCGKPRENGEYAHAIYAPLHNQAYRAKVYAEGAYDTDDDMPSWVQALREVK